MELPWKVFVKHNELAARVVDANAPARVGTNLNRVVERRLSIYRPRGGARSRNARNVSLSRYFGVEHEAAHRANAPACSPCGG
jgi:hypothetical protein